MPFRTVQNSQLETEIAVSAVASGSGPFGVELSAVDSPAAVAVSRFRARLVFLVACDPGIEPFAASLLGSFLDLFDDPVGMDRPLREITFQVAGELAQEEFDRLLVAVSEQYRDIVRRMRMGRAAISVKGLQVQYLDPFTGMWVNALSL